ncbi:S1 family peptidase [Solirubrobacter phytolaccae]|uniref:S1 family peptidase n=1 Tax=Solirubrobacter phytolaccae TaxID=1404360 RepID=A0A9X3NHI1_9ACTN|nr:S1 family peptidase [Solirubrobacter phytolaccae]
MAVATTVITLGSGAVAGAQEPVSVPKVQPVEAVPATEEITSLAAAEGISAAEAQEQLVEQRRIPLLAEAARAQLGDEYGGVWVEDGRIKLAVVSAPGAEGRSALPQETSANVNEAVAAADLGDDVDVVPAPRSEAGLTALQAELDKRLAVANVGAPITIDAESDVKTGTVRLNVPPAPTPEQAQFLATAETEFAGQLSRVAKPAAATTEACTSGAWCDPPLRGGIRLIHGGQGLCSAGFVVRSLIDNKQFLSTAKHCFVGNAGYWSTHFANNSSHNIGGRWSWTEDFGIINIENPGGWNPGPYIRIQSDETYRISGWGSSSVGMRVCFTGGFTDSNCAEVTGGLATREGIPNTYRASYCSVKGDSGGAVFASNNAYGSNIGAYGSCDKFYFSAAAFNTLNVTPQT